VVVVQPQGRDAQHLVGILIDVNDGVVTVVP
jgi:hypothetical protein